MAEEPNTSLSGSRSIKPLPSKTLPTPPSVGRGRGRGRTLTSRSPRNEGDETPPRSPPSSRAPVSHPRSPPTVRVWNRTHTTAERPVSEEVQLRRKSSPRHGSGTGSMLAKHKSVVSRLPAASTVSEPSSPSMNAPTTEAPPPPAHVSASPRIIADAPKEEEEEMEREKPQQKLFVSKRTLQRLSKRISTHDLKKRNDTIRSLDTRIKEALLGDDSEGNAMSDTESMLEDEEDAETNDQVWVWGNRGMEVISHPTPQLLPDLGSKNVKQVCAGSMHSLIVLENGAVYSWGMAKDGRLGHGMSDENLTIPQKVEALSDKVVKMVAAGASSSVAVTHDGACYHWGWLGVEEIPRIFVPNQVEGLEKIRVQYAVCGENHCMVLTVDHSVMSWGLNKSGCLGLGKKEMDFVSTPKTVLGNQEFLAAGRYSGASITMGKGQLMYWGFNLKQKNKPIRKPEKVALKGRSVMVALGAQHMIIMEDTGEVYAMGEGADGQLGTGNYTHQAEPVRVDFPLSREEKLRLRKEKDSQPASNPTPVRGNVPSGGASGKAPSTKPSRFGGSTLKKGDVANANVAMKQFKAFGAGNASSVAVTKEGMVFVWGKIDSNGTESFLQPTLVRALDKIAIDRVSVGADNVVALVGLKNEKDIRYFSFNPPIVKAATLGKLVDWLLSEKVQQDPLFVYTFFASHDVFSTSVDVIDELSTRYDRAKTTEDGKKLQTRLLAVLMQWIKLRPLDFRSPVTKVTMDQFLSKMDPAPQRSIRKCIESEEVSLAQVPVFKAPEADGLMLETISSYSALQVAQQLALVDKKYFDRIRPTPELTHQNWMKTAKRDLSPNVLAFIGRFNKLFYFIVTDCIAHEETNVRSSRFHFWAEVHKHSVALCNLNASVCIASALNSVPIRKLAKREFIVVKPAERQALEDFRRLLSDRNKTGYRELLAKKMNDGDPAIPYLATVLSDLTFIEEGNKNKLQDGLIHFYKFHLIGKQLQAVEDLQKRSFSSLSPDESLQNLLACCDGLDEDQCDKVADKIVAGESISPILAQAEEARKGASSAPDSSDEKGLLMDELVDRLDAEAGKLSKDSSKRLEIWDGWLARAEKDGDEFRAVLSSSCAFSESVDSILLDPLKRQETAVFEILLGKFVSPSVNVPSLMRLLQKIGPVSSIFPEIREEMVRLVVSHEFNAVAEATGANTVKNAPQGFFELAEEEEKRAKEREKLNLLEGIDFGALDTQVYAVSDNLMPVLAVSAMKNLCDYETDVWDDAFASRKMQVEDRISELQAAAGEEEEEYGLTEMNERMEELKGREQELLEALEILRGEMTDLSARILEARRSSQQSKTGTLISKENSTKEAIEAADVALRTYLEKTYTPRQEKLKKRFDRSRQTVLKKAREFFNVFEALKLSLELCLDEEDGEWDQLEKEKKASTREELGKFFNHVLQGYKQVEDVFEVLVEDEHERLENVREDCELLLNP